jgi:hypothetical protein
MATRTLLENEHFRIRVDDDARLVRVVRTAAPFASPESLENAFAEASAVTRVFAGWAVLLDSRDAPARNDPEFEEIFARGRKNLLARFDAIAVLVKSATGRLQVARYAREDGNDPVMFDDESAALEYLAKRPRRSRVTDPPKP